MSSEQKMANADRVYYYVVDDSFRRSVPKDHPEALERVNKNGVTVYEKLTKALFGQIESVSVYEQEFDNKKVRKLNIVLDKNDDGKNPIISLPIESRTAETLLKSLPTMESGVEYRFLIYTNEKGDKKYPALSIKSRDSEGIFTVRVDDFFWDFEKKEGKNGYPTPTEEDKEDWSFYYKKANKFMVKYLEENVLPRFAEKESDSKGFEYPEEEVNTEDSPF